MTPAASNCLSARDTAGADTPIRSANSSNRVEP
ncbi:Uncharacterised protein [Mycobacteroides abscessus subsp. abscessus]|nr:Uncharacterised protein [Mycobacteroides abscessus subsp. abscessus]